MHVRRQYAHRRVAHIHTGAFAFAEVCTGCLLVRSNRHEAWCMHAQLTCPGKISDLQTLLVFVAQQGPTGSSKIARLMRLHKSC
jgi:hypothetical protein